MRRARADTPGARPTCSASGDATEGRWRRFVRPTMDERVLGFDRRGRAQLRSGVRNARATVLAHAGLLYDEQATAESVAAPCVSARARRPRPAADNITQPRAAEPEGAGAREAARQRALARGITSSCSCLKQRHAAR